jgi:hypothetical protein
LQDRSTPAPPEEPDPQLTADVGSIPTFSIGLNKPFPIVTNDTSQLESNSVRLTPDGGSGPLLAKRLDTERLLVMGEPERRQEIRRLDRELKVWERNRSDEQAAWASARVRRGYDRIMPGVREIVGSD